jgi:HEPN domain-containing protein
MGLFNTAESWRLSAIALRAAKIDSGHADMPVIYLFAHALELYLKALLRQHYSVDALERKFRHDTKRIVRKAKALGLVIDEQDAELLRLLADVSIGARYISAGWKRLPDLTELESASKRIRDRVGELLKKRGELIRL